MDNINDDLDSQKIVGEILEQGEIFNDIEEDLLHDLIGGKVSRDNELTHSQTLTFGDNLKQFNGLLSITKAPLL